MILLHDDDCIANEFNDSYFKTIKPVLDSEEAEFCSWRAHLMMDDSSIKPTEWFTAKTGLQPSSQLRSFLLKLGRLSLSPIISVLNRDTLIKSLKEGGPALRKHEECLYKPGMLLGTELIAYLRHCADHPKWMFVNEILSYYGCCASSGTVQVQKGGDLSVITKGYDWARQYFMSGGFEKPEQKPRILFVYDDFTASSKEEQCRFLYAESTWEHQFSTGDMLKFRTEVSQWGRSSADLGDSRPAPYVKDLIDYGVAHAMPEDCIVYANKDICLTTQAYDRILEGVQKHGVAVAWRRNFVPDQGRLYKYSDHAKRDGGVDLIAVSPAWWKEHRNQMPDQLIGRECWDYCFRVMAEEEHGKSVYIDNTIYHCPHDGQFWKANKKSNPGQQHNRALAKIFFARRGNRKALQGLS
jgi:hypothetical protein